MSHHHSIPMVSIAFLLLLLLLASLPSTQGQSSVPIGDASRDAHEGLTEAEFQETRNFLNIVRSTNFWLQFLWPTSGDICNKAYTGVACTKWGVTLSVSTSLTTLNPPNLSDTKFSGLNWDLVYIYSLNFAGTKVTTEVNVGLEKLTRLSGIDFSNTGINGNMPASLTKLTNLMFAYLENTQISGALPSYNWPKMLVLNFANVKLTGGVPSDFVVGDEAVVNFTGTGLTGCLPKTWSAYTRSTAANGNLIDCGGVDTTSTSTSSSTRTPATTSTSRTPATTSTSRAPTTTSTSPTTSTSKAPTTSTTAPGKSQDTKDFLNLLMNAMPNMERNMSDSVDYCNWQGFTTCNETGGEVVFNWQYMSTGGTLPEIPSTIDPAKVEVKALYFSGDYLTGTLPSSWGNLTSLKYLDLSMNRLSGCIPDTWNGLTSLITLQLSQNYLSGNLPAWNLPRLSTAYLSNNRLAGSIPASWGQMPYLQRLSVNGNSLCGCLPSTWPSSLATATAGMAVASSTCATANACTRGRTTCTATGADSNGASYMTSVAAAVLVGVCFVATFLF